MENVDILGKKTYTMHIKANLLKDRDAKPEGSKVLLDYDSRLPHLALRECDMGI